jgi:hypothetical protein
MEEKIIEIKPIFTITMLDHFPRMSVFHQERTGFVTIEQEYYAFIQRESVLLTPISLIKKKYAIPTSRNLNEEFLDPEFPNLKRPDPGRKILPHILFWVEQEYYAFIQRESVLLTWWFLLNLGTIRATSSLLKGEELK